MAEQSEIAKPKRFSFLTEMPVELRELKPTELFSFEDYKFDPVFLQCKQEYPELVYEWIYSVFKYKDVIPEASITILNDLCDRKLGAYISHCGYGTLQPNRYSSRVTENWCMFTCVCSDDVRDMLLVKNCAVERENDERLKQDLKAQIEVLCKNN